MIIFFLNRLRSIQSLHSDYFQIFPADTQKAALSLILSLDSDGFCLEVNKTAYEFVKQQQPKVGEEGISVKATEELVKRYCEEEKLEDQVYELGGVRIKPNQAVVFRGDLPHAGGMCGSKHNLRGHAYFCPPQYWYPPDKVLYWF